MTQRNRAKGTGLLRFTIHAFTLVFAVLVYWLLGFLVEDIRSVPGPRYETVEPNFVDPELVAERDRLNTEIAELNRQLENEAEKQRVIGDSSQNLQQTISQLVELRKLAIDQNTATTEAEQADFSQTLALFLENQRRYQALNQTTADLISQKQEREASRTTAEQQIETQRQPAREAFQTLQEQHRLRLAFWQLAILIPILAGAATLMVKKKASIYFPLFLAFGIATLLKVTLVMHEYFPTRYFKYVLIGALLLVVFKFLTHLIRTIAFPKTEWLIKQYREAYERFLCPVCEFPIRTGPRRYLYWTRRTVKKLVPRGESATKEEPYTCPSCGEALYVECAACHQVRHALLPHCAHCGDSTPVKPA